MGEEFERSIEYLENVEALRVMWHSAMCHEEK